MPFMHQLIGQECKSYSFIKGLREGASQSSHNDRMKLEQFRKLQSQYVILKRCFSSVIYTGTLCTYLRKCFLQIEYATNAVL